MKRVTVRLSAAARDDVRQLADYGAETFGKAAAYAYLDGLDRAFETISQFPEAGRAVQVHGRTVRALIYRHHVITYAVADTQARVIRVLPGMSEWMSMLAESIDRDLN